MRTADQTTAITAIESRCRCHHRLKPTVECAEKGASIDFIDPARALGREVIVREGYAWRKASKVALDRSLQRPQRKSLNPHRLASARPKRAELLIVGRPYRHPLPSDCGRQQALAFEPDRKEQRAGT